MRKLRGFEFHDPDAFWVFPNIENGTREVRRILQGDDAGFCEKNERPTSLRRIVGNPDTSTLFEFIKRLDFIRIKGHRECEGLADGCQFVAAVTAGGV